MNRFIQYFNLLGILLLAAICAVQWQADSRLNLEIIRINSLRQEQSAQIAAQEKTLSENASDLDDFRQRLKLSEAALTQSKTNLAAATRLNTQLTQERDSLKATLDQWIAAVAARDEVLKKNNDQIQMLLTDRNTAINNFNDLVAKYNDLMKTVNDSRAK